MLSPVQCEISSLESHVLQVCQHWYVQAAPRAARACRARPPLTMTIPAERHADRADAVADSIRTHLVAFNTGGIGVCLAAAASLVDSCVRPSWVIPAVAFFSAGLVAVVASLFLQRHKALKRRNAATANEVVPSFTSYLWRNFTWDLISLSLFCTGVALGLAALWCMSPGCPSRG